MILATVNDSCFSIGGTPYRKSSLYPTFDSTNQKIGFRREINPGYDLVGPFHYSDYTDASTGLPFATYSALIAWIEANLFIMPVGGSGSTTLAFMQTLFVVAAPAADDEVAAGATIAHEFLDSGALQIASVNGIDWVVGDFTHTTGAGAGELELTTPARAFAVGDVVVLFKNP